MKGLIAPLLVTMMTGMVFCQQPQSENFASGSGAKSVEPALLGKYLLIMDQELVRGLKTHGYLQSVIKPSDRETIDHVIFHGNDRNSRNLSLSPADIQQTAASDDDRRLEFTLTDDLIKMMRRDGLRYIIPQQDVGKYDEVVVYFKRSESVRPLSRVENETDRARTREFDQIAEQQSRINDSVLDRKNPALDRIRTTENDFGRMREPKIGRDLAKSRDSADRELLGSRQSFTPRVGGTNNFASDNTTRDLEFSTRGIDLGKRRIRSDRFESERSNIVRGVQGDMDRERFVTNVGNAFDRPEQIPTRTQRDELDRRQESEAIPRFDDLNDRSFRDSNREIELARMAKLQAENDALVRRLREEEMIRDRRERELDDANLARLRAEKEVLRRDSESLDNPYGGSYRRRPIENPTNRYPNRFQEDFGDQLVAKEVDRNAYVGTESSNSRNSTLRPTSRPPELAINGPQNESGRDPNMNSSVDQQQLLAETERSKRNTQVLWFIMLCSVGLNFYLALIARSFYVRYEELADELRDTFTSNAV